MGGGSGGMTRVRYLVWLVPGGPEETGPPDFAREEVLLYRSNRLSAGIARRRCWRTLRRMLSRRMRRETLPAWAGTRPTCWMQSRLQSW